MGSCFTKNTTPPPLSPLSEPKTAPLQPTNDTKKKEVFVIKHRISHETDRHSNNTNPSSTTNTEAVGGANGNSSCSKDELDAILVQSGRLSRSNSTGAENVSNRNKTRKYSRYNRSCDFDLSSSLKNENFENEDEEGVRVSSRASSRRTSRERDSRYRRRSGSRDRERRISISPSRRSSSPFGNGNGNVVGGGSGSGNRPVKMVSVPATDKSGGAGVRGEEMGVGVVKRIHVKRNVSPAKTRLRVYNDAESPGGGHQEAGSMEADSLYYRRKSLVEIDNNSTRAVLSGNGKMGRMRKLSRDLDVNPSPPSYASLLLEDINNFHKKNTSTTTAVSAQPAFALPECVTKACSIMEAVADLNSNTSSLLSDDRWKTSRKIDCSSDGKSQIDKDSCTGTESGTEVNDVAVQEQESREPNSATREREVRGLGGFKRDFMDYPRKGIGRGRKNTCTTIVST